MFVYREVTIPVSPVKPRRFTSKFEAISRARVRRALHGSRRRPQRAPSRFKTPRRAAQTAWRRLCFS